VLPAWRCRPSGAAEGMRTGPRVWQLGGVSRRRLLMLGQTAGGAGCAASSRSAESWRPPCGPAQLPTVHAGVVSAPAKGWQHEGTASRRSCQHRGWQGRVLLVLSSYWVQAESCFQGRVFGWKLHVQLSFVSCPQVLLYVTCIKPALAQIMVCLRWQCVRLQGR